MSNWVEAIHESAVTCQPTQLSIVELPRVRPQLPIDAILPTVIKSLSQQSLVVIQATAGAGKTTRVPPAMLDAGLAGNGQIWVLQPRRVAARASARRMAMERSQKVGEEIGYVTRFDRQISTRTRIVVATEGVLVRRLLQDPFLEGIGALIFDEFHERHLETDLSLSMVGRVQETVRPDLKLVVMSATLDLALLEQFSNRRAATLPIIQCPTGVFPVKVEYAQPTSDPLPVELAKATLDLLARTDGDVLVFLPGVRESRDAQASLRDRLDSHKYSVLPMYGDLSAEDQDRVFEPVAGRKIVLATNIAETSLTIPGITGVIDSGLARVLEWNAGTGLNRLSLTSISKASAEQRAGRAGRTAPGICLRLWTAAAQRIRPEHDLPEIHRIDLSGAVLQLIVWGESRVDQFPWFETPSTQALEHALNLLQRLGAIETVGESLRDSQHAVRTDSPTTLTDPAENIESPPATSSDHGTDFGGEHALRVAERLGYRAWRATDLGKRMAELPIHPRLARLLLASYSPQTIRQLAFAAALVSERNPFLKGDQASSIDLREWIDVIDEFDRTGRTDFACGSLHRGAASAVVQAAKQLQRLVSKSREGVTPGGNTQALELAALAAFPDRVAKLRDEVISKTGSQPLAIMSGGRGVRLARPARQARTWSESGLFVAIDIDDAGKDALVRLAVPIERHHLDLSDQSQPGHLNTLVDLEFNATEERVQARRRVCWGDVVLEESPVGLPSDGRAADVLAAAVRENWAKQFSGNSADLVLDAAGIESAVSLGTGTSADSPERQVINELVMWFARLRSLAGWMPELQLPTWTLADWLAILPELCAGRRSFAELRRGPWQEKFGQQLTAHQQQTLSREAPEKLAVPSGRRYSIRYEVGRPPIFSVRIQEVFGWKQTPRIAAGRVPLLLELLAPNYRPQQLTDDLPSFWANGYPRLRSELRRRYPKHAWPENPTNPQ